jgi:hypothetical protein
MPAQPPLKMKTPGFWPGGFIGLVDLSVDQFFFGGLAQFRNFVLEQQLASFEFVYLELVEGGMELFLLDFPLKRHVTALEFGEMALQGHAQLLSMLERQDCDTIHGTRKGEYFCQKVVT